MAVVTRARSTLSVALALGALALTACGGLSSLPSRGGPAWFELRSPHFVLRTDLERERAIATLQTLERLLRAYLLFGWNAKGSPEPLPVVVMRRADDVHRLMPGYDGMYLTHPSLPPVAVAPWREGPEGLATIKHELTHHVAHAVIPRQPPWFSEGTATFFETAWFDHKGRFVIGTLPAERIWHGPMPSDELLSQHADRADPRFYSNAWLLVHYLYTRRGTDFARYQRALAAGRSFEDAWRESFTDLDHARLDQVLAAYLRSGPFKSGAYRFTHEPVPMRIRALHDADVFALRARLYFQCQPENWRLQGRANVELALQADPRQLEAGMLKLLFMSRTLDEQLALASALTAAHPRAWEAWWLRARLEADHPQASARTAAGLRALDQLLALRPRHPRGLVLAADRELRAGRMQEALRLSAAALRSAPVDPLVIEVRAELLRRAGEQAAACDLAYRLTALLAEMGDSERGAAAVTRHCSARSPSGRSRAPMPGAGLVAPGRPRDRANAERADR
jgi:hypothetical protein